MNNFILIYLTMYINTFSERNKLEYVGQNPSKPEGPYTKCLVGWLVQCRELNRGTQDPGFNLTYTALKNEFWLN